MNLAKAWPRLIFFISFLLLFVMVNALKIGGKVSYAYIPIIESKPYIVPLLVKIDKYQLSNLLTDYIQQIASGNTVYINSSNYGLLTVDSTIMISLQSAAEFWLRQIKDIRAAIVIVEATTGKVLVMAGMRNGKIDHRVALKADAPAASLFKIITAAAAVEDAYLDIFSPLFFKGDTHSFNRSQLTLSNNYVANQTTLRQGFANSNNSIFGKIGIFYLGGNLLNWYAKVIGFDNRLPFELPLEISQFSFFHLNDDFTIAAVASGYNNVTTISPIHAALLVGLFINQGRFIEPYIIQRVTDSNQVLLYTGQTCSLGRIVSERTCQSMRRLFEATINEGTARSAFNQLNKDIILHNLALGGKTGTFSGLDNTELFEWFAGYSRDDQSGYSLAIAVVVVHRHNVRLANAKYLARLMLRQAFAVFLSSSNF